MTPIFRTELMPMAKISVGGTNMSKKKCIEARFSEFPIQKIKM